MAKHVTFTFLKQSTQSECHFLSSCSLDQILQDRERNPEDVLQSLGFGSTESDSSISCRIPDRFLTSQSQAAGISVDLYAQHNPDIRDYISMVQTMSQDGGSMSGQSPVGHALGHGEGHMAVRQSFKCLQDLISYLLDMNVPDRFLDSCEENFKDLPEVLPEKTSACQPAAGQMTVCQELESDHPVVNRERAFAETGQDSADQINAAESPNGGAHFKDTVLNYTSSSPRDRAGQILTSASSEAKPEMEIVQQGSEPEQVSGDTCSEIVPNLSQKSITTLSSRSPIVNRSISYHTATSDFTVIPDNKRAPKVQSSIPKIANNPPTVRKSALVPNSLPVESNENIHSSHGYVFSYTQPPPYVRPPPVDDLCNSSSHNSVSIESQRPLEKPLRNGRPPPYVRPSPPKEKSQESSRSHAQDPKLSHLRDSTGNGAVPSTRKLSPVRAKAGVKSWSPVNGQASPEILSEIPTDNENFQPNVLTHVRLPTPERAERPGSLGLSNHSDGREEGEGSFSPHAGSTASSRAYFSAPISPNETLV